MDPIADMFARIKNSQLRKKDAVSIPASKIKTNIAKLLKDEGFIKSFEVVGVGEKKEIKIKLKFRMDQYGKIETGAIADIVKVSKPGCRIYVAKSKIPRIMGGFGVSILSTPLGVLTDVEARKKNTGGELLAYVH
jgi:small subunit ribosomal protein S8